MKKQENKDYKQIALKQIMKAYDKGIKSIKPNKIHNEYSLKEGTNYSYKFYEDFEKINEAIKELEEEGFIEIKYDTTNFLNQKYWIKSIHIIKEKIDSLYDDVK